MLSFPEFVTVSGGGFSRFEIAKTPEFASSGSAGSELSDIAFIALRLLHCVYCVSENCLKENTDSFRRTGDRAPGCKFQELSVFRLYH